MARELFKTFAYEVTELKSGGRGKERDALSNMAGP